MFFLGRELFGHREGLIAAALTAIGWLPSYFSQDARPYTLLLLAICILSLYFWRLLQVWQVHGKTPLLDSSLFVISSSIACYLHYFGVVLFGTQVLYLFGAALVNKRRTRYLLASIVISLAVLVLYAPWDDHQ